MNRASHPYNTKGGAPCGVGWAACEFQSCAAAMRGVRHISDFEGWATRLNLYAMVSDNPETFADLDGHLFAGAEISEERPGPPLAGIDDPFQGVTPWTDGSQAAQAAATATPQADQQPQTPQAQNNNNQAVGNTTEGELAKTMTHEDGSLSTPKKGDPDVLSDAKEALANSIINNAELKKPEQVATPDRSASAQDAQIMKDAVANRANGGADPVEGRHYYGTTHDPNVQSRPAGNHLKGEAGRETVYEKFGPSRDSVSRRPTWIVIYNNPGQ